MNYINAFFSKEETVTEILSILFKSDNFYQLKLVWMKENTEIPQGLSQSIALFICPDLS